ncbi:MAG: eukaryotic-like serine/threonine-protein kinase [Blastocatellia bacterium]|nr:eukaryotic-like serine/threonine-protein kinase [Blastocatellia bacterium]
MLQCPRCGRKFPDEVHVCPDDFTPLQADATLSDVPVDPLIGRVFEGKYRLDERLGGGGMGTVYRATHMLIERPVAVKVLSQRFVGDETAQQRFRREARASGRMQHPNAVMVNDFGATEDGWLYIVMELLEGQTLRDLLMREAPLDPARAVSFMLQTCAAVGAAHDAGLIHRDLKPANIFIEQRPHLAAVVKVLDFGVAKFVVEEHDDDYNTLTQVGAIIGTPRYMSPEQCSGAAPLTPASDVYSLGIILYEMLTGAVPFSADTPLALALKQVSEPPVRPRKVVPTIPAELEGVVMHALAKDPRFRPADANELRRELHEVAVDLGLEHSTSTLAPSLAELRNAGTESPSGRLVIDLATLRQVQAASTSDSFPGALLKEQTGSTAPNENRKRFPRMNVSLAKQSAAARANRLPLIAAAIIVLVAILGSGVLAARWWRGSVLSNGGPTAANANVATAASPSPTVSPTPSPTPAAKPARKPEPPKKEKPSKLKSIWNKAKGIFR